MKTINTTVNKDNNSITIYLHHAIDVESFDNKIKAIDSGVYLDRLRKEYNHFKSLKIGSKKQGLQIDRYYNMRLFCLDTCLLSFNDIEVMEYEINLLF